MGVTALVMAGGKGVRMALSEKPLLEIGGKTIIEHVLVALKNTKKVDSVVVAVTDYTPKTAKLMAKLRIKVIQTPGTEYVSDMRYAVKKLKLHTVLTIAADLPFITGKIIDYVIEYYEQCSKPALTVVVPLATKEKFGLGGAYAFKAEERLVVPAGINVIDGRRIEEKELDEELCVLDRKEVALNINTIQELRIAETLFAECY